MGWWVSCFEKPANTPAIAAASEHAVAAKIAKISSHLISGILRHDFQRLADLGVRRSAGTTLIRAHRNTHIS